MLKKKTICMFFTMLMFVISSSILAACCGPQDYTLSIVFDGVGLITANNLAEAVIKTASIIDKAINL